MDVNKVLRELIFRHNSYPALKLAWECQLPICSKTLPLISPTHYIKELGMSTEERLELLCKQQRKLEFWEPGMNFSVLPVIVVFQNFQPRKSYCIQINIRNISKNTQKIGLLMEKTSEFSLDEKSIQVTKFAPGMIFKASIHFHPQEDRDFFQKLVIITKESRFAIPILGIGGRGILNPPDSIDFVKVPVKYLKTKMITMRNIGSRTAKFLVAADGPFCVSLERGIVEPKETFVMDVSFYSETSMKAEGNLVIRYENGEVVTVKLRGEAIDDCITIFPPCIQFDDTYMGLKSYSIVQIKNNTSVVAQFKWKKYYSKAEAADATATGDNLSKYDNHWNAMFYGNHSYHRYNDNVDDKILVKPEVCLQCDDLNGILQEEDEDGLFPPEEFLIEPVWGKVQPYSTTECMLIFSPYKPQFYETHAYCDMTGREERQTLCLRGQSIKPTFTFGFDDNFEPLPLDQAHTNKTELVTEEATFGITIGGEHAGDIKIALFGDKVPKTVKNFATICSQGVDGKTYAGSVFHRVIKNFMIQGGDIIRGDGTGSTSIYGSRFDDENFSIKHTDAGFLSMANSGPNTNGCQFFITAVATPWLDGHHVVFGKVVDGLPLVKSIEMSQTGSNDRPVKAVMINTCSVRQLQQPYDLPLNHIWSWILVVGPPLSFSLMIVLLFQWIIQKLDKSCEAIDKMVEDEKLTLNKLPKTKVQLDPDKAGSTRHLSTNKENELEQEKFKSE